MEISDLPDDVITRFLMPTLAPGDLSRLQRTNKRFFELASLCRYLCVRMDDRRVRIFWKGGDADLGQKGRFIALGSGHQSREIQVTLVGPKVWSSKDQDCVDTSVCRFSREELQDDCEWGMQTTVIFEETPRFRVKSSRPTWFALSRIVRRILQVSFLFQRLCYRYPE